MVRRGRRFESAGGLSQKALQFGCLRLLSGYRANRRGHIADTHLAGERHAGDVELAPGERLHGAYRVRLAAAYVPRSRVNVARSLSAASASTIPGRCAGASTSA
jgi:hypothetical protein